MSLDLACIRTSLKQQQDARLSDKTSSSIKCREHGAYELLLPPASEEICDWTRDFREVPDTFHER